MTVGVQLNMLDDHSVGVVLLLDVGDFTNFYVPGGKVHVLEWIVLYRVFSFSLATVL